MKKLILLITIVILLLVLLSPLLPAERIQIYSNVEISPDDIFKKAGTLYFVYQLKIPAKIHRKPLSVNVFYNETILGTIHFTDGDFAISSKGHIINKEEELENNLFAVFADFTSKNWNEDFILLFVNLNNLNILDAVDKFSIENEMIAFYDKNKILVIMKKGDYKKKLQEYKKVIELFNEEIYNIKEINLQYKEQAVIKWRGK